MTSTGLCTASEVQRVFEHYVGKQQRQVHERVVTGIIIYTDEAHIYRRAISAPGFQHRTIEHQAEVQVNGGVHAQTIEGFRSPVKRGISGTCHAVPRSGSRARERVRLVVQPPPRRPGDVRPIDPSCAGSTCVRV
jgi:hypothetical protein